MRSQYQPIIILSAELSTNDYGTNEQKSFSLLSDLEQYTTMPVMGVYKGTSERGVIVHINDDYTLSALKELAFTKYKQESILYRDNENKAYLHYSNGEIQYLGELKQVSEQEALSQDAYTKTDNGYFIAK